MKNIIWGYFSAFFLTINFVFSGIVSAAEDYSDKANQTKQELTLYANAAVLMDADSGRVLFSKNADSVLPMASTTKIMTCILLLENLDISEELTVSAYAESMPKVKLYIRKGEKYKVEDLLYSLMLESHNDSAVALAEYMGNKLLMEKEKGENKEADIRNDSKQNNTDESKRAVAAFALKMNQKAVEIGCENTWFITPNGLDATQDIELKDGRSVQKEHSTTAKDLAQIMSYCIKKSPKKEEFLRITGTKEYSFYANGRNYSCTNHNAFLDKMEGALSGKTGFTNKAGYCYVGALQREERTFVVALLACGWPNHKTYKWYDTEKMMKYGINHYYYRKFHDGDYAFDESILTPIAVVNGQPQELGEVAYVPIGLNREMLQEKKENNPNIENETNTDYQNNIKELRNNSCQNPMEKKCVFGKMKSENFQGILLKEGEKPEISYRVEETLTAPVKAGTVVGTVTYAVDGEIYLSENIITLDDVSRIDLPWCIDCILKRFFL